MLIFGTGSCLLTTIVFVLITFISMPYGLPFSLTAVTSSCRSKVHSVIKAVSSAYNHCCSILKKLSICLPLIPQQLSRNLSRWLPNKCYATFIVKLKLSNHYKNALSKDCKSLISSIILKEHIVLGRRRLLPLGIEAQINLC